MMFRAFNLPILLLLLLFVLTPSFQQNSQAFANYVTTYGKLYNQSEYKIRQSQYLLRSTSFVDTDTYKYRINNFTDWTSYEISNLFNTQSTFPNQAVYYGQPPARTYGNQITAFDWRTKNVVTPVKNQYMCGAGWAHASTALMETFLIRNRYRPNNIDLSENYLFECVPESGCQFGTIDSALNYLLAYAPTQSQYSVRAPIVSGTNFQNRCYGQALLDNPPRRRIYFGISDAQMIALIEQGPVAAMVFANQGLWISYGNGTIACPSTVALTANHAVLVVGYTATQYIIKNSWGTNWGVNGYGFVSRTPSLNCLITSEVHALHGNLLSNVLLIMALLVFGFLM